VIRKGDKVEILPEWQDPGEERYIYIAVSDEHDGRVDIQAINFEWEFAPVNTVKVEMLQCNDVKR